MHPSHWLDTQLAKLAAFSLLSSWNAYRRNERAQQSWIRPQACRCLHDIYRVAHNGSEPVLVPAHGQTNQDSRRDSCNDAEESVVAQNCG